MRVVLISMPDVIPIVIHEAALHMPNHGIACVAGNIDPGHEVFLIDLVRKRRRIVPYLSRTLGRIRPDLVGLSAMTWQYGTCQALIRLIREILPGVKIAVGGYHPTLMYREIGDSPAGALVDFIVRGEGEEPFRRLVNALAGDDALAAIPSLSYREDGAWRHNEAAPLADLSRLKLPVRDRRRLTGGYHFMNLRIEVMETSRGCTRDCHFCSIRHMYGRSYRTYPCERIIADLDDIYYRKKVRLVFITDDNLVLNPNWVRTLCDAIIARKYRGLKLIVQADCLSVARNEAMVARMAEAGFRGLFLGIENASTRNLEAMGKGDIVAAARQAVEICHRHGIMVIGGLIFGLPEDDREAIRQNYAFLKELDADAAYCQMLTPYPKTRLREDLLAQGLVTNPEGLDRYNGLWANVRTRRLSDAELAYAFWHDRQTVLGWWTPSPFVVSQGQLWTSLWTHLVKPVLKWFVDRQMRTPCGMEQRYRAYGQSLAEMNRFVELDRFRGEGPPGQTETAPGSSQPVEG